MDHGGVAQRRDAVRDTVGMEDVQGLAHDLGAACLGIAPPAGQDHTSWWQRLLGRQPPASATPVPGNVWVRGAIVQGSDLRPPLGIEVKIEGKDIFAVRME